MPATDIYFSQGPMDVLDHSCSKMGFGGKMCIDGTTKWEEEKDDSYIPIPGAIDFPSGELPIQFPEIISVNAKLLAKDIPVMLIAVRKNRRHHVNELHSALCKAIPQMKAIKMVLYVEHTVDPQDLTTALWRFCNNIDPKRDHILYKGNRSTDPDHSFLYGI